MEYLSSDKIAIVDLKTKEVEEEELYEDIITECIGGVGITKRLYDRFADENPIVLGTGLLTGSFVPGSSLGVITAKSPRTGKVCHAPFCMYTGMEMKYAGFDYLVIKGASETPVYLWLHDGIVDINDADGIMGKTAWELVDINTGLRAELGDELIQFLSVGKAAADGSDIAQILTNCWSSGDRWGFGKIFGDMKLKTIAMRGMGLLELANPQSFVDACLELTAKVKDGKSLAQKGCIEFAAAVGEEDLKDWIAPLVHRHSAGFNTPYPANTFVKYNEDPKILAESEIEEPGVMITDVYGLLGFKKMGLSAENSCRMIEACNRYGVDPVAASDLLGKSGKSDLEELKGALENLQGAPSNDGSGNFSPCCPPLPLFVDFQGSGDPGWWEWRQAVSYIFGIDPVFALMAPELSEEKLIELVNIGTDLEITSETLNSVVADIIG